MRGFRAGMTPAEGGHRRAKVPPLTRDASDGTAGRGAASRGTSRDRTLQGRGARCTPGDGLLKARVPMGRAPAAASGRMAGPCLSHQPCGLCRRLAQAIGEEPLAGASAAALRRGPRRAVGADRATLGEVTLTAIAERVLHNAAERFPIFSSLEGRTDERDPVPGAPRARSAPCQRLRADGGRSGSCWWSSSRCSAT